MKYISFLVFLQKYGMILIRKNQGKMRMNCKEVEKNIPRFIRKECSVKEEIALLEHILHCPECKEELSIQFLLTEGIQRLENGESFDLNKELDKLLKEQANAKKKPRTGMDAEKKRILWDILTGAFIAGIVILLLLWKVH